MTEEIKLEKAIEILDNFDNPLRLYTVKECKAAAKLGILAMKRVKLARKEFVYVKPSLLPGETKE